MSKTERALLLFLETCAVDYGGTIDIRHINSDDFEIIGKWSQNGFIEFGRVSSDSLRKGALRTHCVVLSEGAWDLAHRERRARYARIYGARRWETAKEKRLRESESN